ncbi:Schwann cell myelin protein-like [Cebidichthys violaceus]|uniref:Schwann cell myelin protein-like n=1 Tax=Cebidichthys violaceus TaxID=271503 RepID=UPI0035CABE27
MRGAAMSLSAAASVFLLSVSVIQAQDVWGVAYTSTQICAVKRSTVEIRCNYSHPSTINGLKTQVEEKFWFTKTSNDVYVDLRTDPEYSGRVTSHYAPKLPSVSVSSSAEIVEGSSVILTCSSDANPAANYIWYKENQIKLQGPEGVYRFTSISSEDRGIYYCKSENKHGWIHSTSLVLDVQYPPRLPSVSMSSSGEIVEGSSVTLTCSSDATGHRLQATDAIGGEHVFADLVVVSNCCH